MAIFRVFFKMAAAAILDFQILDILKSERSIGPTTKLRQCIDREFGFYEFFSFLKFNEFYEFFFG